MEFKRDFYMKIIVIIIPTNLVTNSLVSLLCPFIETKNKNKIFSKLEVARNSFASFYSNIFTYKRTCNSECTKSFKQNLHEIEWIEIETLQNPNKAYKTVSQKVVTSFDNYFLERKIKMENKDSQIPTITREIKRSSKRNQSLNEKLFKKSKQAKRT